MEETQKLPTFDGTAPYTIDREYYREGFAAFQKKYVLRRNLVMMILFAVLLVSFVAAAVSDPGNKMAYFLMMLCLAAMFMLWYNPRKQRRMVMDAVRELEGEQYTAACDGTVLRIQIQQAETEAEKIAESRIVLETAWIREFPAFYLVCDGKRMFYILPKAALEQTAAETAQVSEWAAKESDENVSRETT